MMLAPRKEQPSPGLHGELRSRWEGRGVLITGHTGFKGAWLAFWLQRLGARVCGIALAPHTQPSLFDELDLGSLIADHRCDIRNLPELEEITQSFAPEVVFHLAAQPIVLEAYRNPPETFHTNVLGSVNVFEAVRRTPSVRVLIHVSSDKCYLPDASGGPYREDHPLGGADPYSASKAAADIALGSYLRTLFPSDGRVLAASVRAGNVIGGGDWAAHRILPDAARALSRGAPVPVRNPGHVRPWQHVLDALCGYLTLAAGLLEKREELVGAWNFGPDARDEHSVQELVEAFIRYWGEGRWERKDIPGTAHESRRLTLDSTRARRELGWRPRWDFSAAVRRTAEWYRRFYAGEPATELCLWDISEYGGIP